jgi:hypothetical protein
MRRHTLRHAEGAGDATRCPPDITVTLKVYAHVMPGDDEDAAIRADDLLGGDSVTRL